MKCPHCDKEITEEDELVSEALKAACPDQHVEQVEYSPSSHLNKSMEIIGFSARGTFVADGEHRNFAIGFDQYRRLTHFQQEKKK